MQRLESARFDSVYERELQGSIPRTIVKKWRISGTAGTGLQLKVAVNGKVGTFVQRHSTKL